MSGGMTRLVPSSWRSDARRILVCRALAVVWLPWLVARVLTLGALGMARYEIRTLPIHSTKAVAAVHNGLLGADAGWYRAIAGHGYQFAYQSLRFFPLLPESTRLAHDVLRLPVDVALLLIVNVAAFVGAMVVYVLTRSEVGDEQVARRAVWLFNLAPPAFILVMGYSEALFVVLAAATFLSIRRQWWGWAILWGFLAGTARPLGFLLVIPVVIEAARTWRQAGSGSRVVRSLAAAAPVAGLLAFLSWTAVAFGDFFAPFRLQRRDVPRSVSGDPLTNLYRDGRAALHGSHFGSGLHLPWIALALVLCVVVFCRLPASFGAFAIAVVVAGMAGVNFRVVRTLRVERLSPDHRGRHVAEVRAGNGRGPGAQRRRALRLCPAYLPGCLRALTAGVWPMPGLPQRPSVLSARRSGPPADRISVTVQVPLSWADAQVSAQPGIGKVGIHGSPR